MRRSAHCKSLTFLLLLPRPLFLSQGSAFGAPLAGIPLDSFGGSDAGVKAYTVPLLVMGFISLLAASALLLLRFRIGGIDLRKRV
jgi:hypothetical protein